MERLLQRLAVAEKALAAFEEIMRIPNPTAIERDAAIQRFEFTFEAVWKAARQLLYDVEGIDAGSPKAVVRACREAGLLDDAGARRALEMVDDRNLTVHTYNEALAMEIYGRLQGYMELMRRWLEGMRGAAARFSR